MLNGRQQFENCIYISINWNHFICKSNIFNTSWIGSYSFTIETFGIFQVKSQTTIILVKRTLIHSLCTHSICFIEFFNQSVDVLILNQSEKQWWWWAVWVSASSPISFDRNKRFTWKFGQQFGMWIKVINFPLNFSFEQHTVHIIG